MQHLRTRSRKSANPGWWIRKSAPANREHSKNIVDSHPIVYSQSPGIAELWIFCWINCNIVAPFAQLLGFGRSGSPKIAPGPTARAIFGEPARRVILCLRDFLPTSALSAVQLRLVCKRSRGLVVLGRFWISRQIPSSLFHYVIQSWVCHFGHTRLNWQCGLNMIRLMNIPSE